MLPAQSCAYQSFVTSTGLPSSVTTSLTTLAVMPFAISFVFVVTLTTTRARDPWGVVSR